MAKRKLLDFIPFGGCAHEFSWPRRWPDGEYYQVCLLCGAEYRYDWISMRRTERITAESVLLQHRFVPADRKKPTWSPRARRLKVGYELKYRARGSAQWNSGTMQNISQSGVLFHGPDAVPGDAIEMIFEMPKEIAGQEGRKVVCNGNVVRSHSSADGQFTYAVSISYYRFLHHGRENWHVQRPKPPGPCDADADPEPKSQFDKGQGMKPREADRRLFENFLATVDALERETKNPKKSEERIATLRAKSLKIVELLRSKFANRK